MKSEVRKNQGESGVALATLLKSGLKVVFDQTGNAYQVEDVEKWKGRPNGKYRITMTQRGDQILFVNPMPGQYVGEFGGIGGRVNDVPEIAIQRGGPRQTLDGRSWWADDQMVWKPQVKVITEGIYKDMLVTYVIPYCFAPVPGTQFTKITGTRAAVNQNENFLRAMGMDLLNTEIPFSQNVLPWLEAHLLEVKQPFLFSIDENGFIDRKSLSSVPPELLARSVKKTTKRSK